MDRISPSTVVYFSHPNCPFCDKLESDLLSLEIKFEKVLLTDENRNELIALTNCKTVPQLFIGKKFIGGYREFCVLCSSNFDQLVQELVSIGHPAPKYDF
jgi:glutaredoxin